MDKYDGSKLLGVMIAIFLIVCMTCAIVMLPKPSKGKGSTLIDLQIESTKLEIQILKLNLSKDVLTIDDINAIYACVDTKIKNASNKSNFPCIAIRGDSF